MNLWNSGISICCAESDNATAGSGCTSAITASAPIASAAFAVGNNKSLRPVECVTSTTTGKCVSFFKIGTAEMSNVLRVALSYVRIPRSQRIIWSLPCAMMYSAALMNSSIVAANPRFNNTGLLTLPTARSKSSFACYVHQLELHQRSLMPFQHRSDLKFH